MKYFQEHFFVRYGSSFEGLDCEANAAIWNETARAICAEYELELSWLLPQLSPSAKKFIKQNHSFHDDVINEVKLTTNAIVIEVPSGKLCISDVLHLKIDLDHESLNCWLYDEFVCPKPDSRLAEGYFEFNVLTQNGEISITAKEIAFTPKLRSKRHRSSHS